MANDKKTKSTIVAYVVGSRENKTPEQDEKGIMKHLSVFENEFGRYCPELPMKP